MTPGFRRRRLLDRSLAAGLVVVVAVIGLVVYHASDIRNANLVTSSPGTAPSGAWSAASVPSPSSLVPTSLVQKWSTATDSTFGAVASASGVVVTTDLHTVTAHDAVTGVVRWSYSRSNRTLCAVGSGDIGPTDMSSNSLVPGITVVYDENGFCSQVMTFDPVTGARGKVRTSANQEHGSLAFGGSYAGWLGPTRLEVWRYDLVRTIQYGAQINPPKSGWSRLGCTFTDLELAANQFATVEHCPAEGANARVVLNFDDPGSVANHPNDWDTFQHTVRVDIDTKAAAARIVGVTADRVAVLVSGPTPAVVVYDATGKETSRTPVQIPAADIVAADSVAKPATVTPAVQTATERFSLVGSHVLAISTPIIQAVAPTTSFSASATTTPSSSVTDALGSSSASKQVDIADLKLDWTAANALGLPTTLGSTVLLPTSKGLSTFDVATGPLTLDPASAPTIAVDRGGYTGRVDAFSIGSMVVEERGPTVVGLSGPQG